MVIRLRDLGDRHSVIVQLTLAGIKRVEAVMPVLFEQENQLLANLSQTETKTLVKRLRKFLATVNRQSQW